MIDAGKTAILKSLLPAVATFLAKLIPTPIPAVAVATTIYNTSFGGLPVTVCVGMPVLGVVDLSANERHSPIRYARRKRPRSLAR